MGILTKIRGLYRFDGDTEPLTVSRRSFFYCSGIVLAGLVLPENKVLATVAAGPGRTYPLTVWPIYDSATGRTTGNVLYVSEVDHANKTITFDLGPDPMVRTFNPDGGDICGMGKPHGSWWPNFKPGIYKEYDYRLFRTGGK